LDNDSWKSYVNKNYTGATQTCTEVEQMMAAGTGEVWSLTSNQQTPMEHLSQQCVIYSHSYFMSKITTV